mmetsp:Transcript_85174/g.168994  ORF Transcript_85174/g.168994 Transcript_85174/m.168994 type:complete len:82 (+) Transcript_85174:360-605(+)
MSATSRTLSIIRFYTGVAAHLGMQIMQSFYMTCLRRVGCRVPPKSPEEIKIDSEKRHAGIKDAPLPYEPRSLQQPCLGTLL